MFDVSFSELLVIAVIALLVIGPEKLPKVARTLGALSGRLQRYVAQVKEEVNREARFEELQKLQAEIKQGVMQTETRVNSELQAAEATLSSKPKPSPKAKPAKAPSTKISSTKTISAKTSKAKG